mmetsp:Transcript_12905/g.26000  ORF Transcript_12905/g.26000 Transcript_12905/m.26000 type:complete len:85 (+) Transcript_12905:1128-1382(+)
MATLPTVYHLLLLINASPLPTTAADASSTAAVQGPPAPGDSSIDTSSTTPNTFTPAVYVAQVEDTLALRQLVVPMILLRLFSVG